MTLCCQLVHTFLPDAVPLLLRDANVVERALDLSSSVHNKLLAANATTMAPLLHSRYALRPHHAFYVRGGEGGGACSTLRVRAVTMETLV
jgi:hypothetical protein